MSYKCPCCQKDVQPPSEQEQAEDMGALFSCDHCQSVLKREGSNLEVVFESKANEADLVEADIGGAGDIKKEEVADQERELVSLGVVSEEEPVSTSDLGVAEEEPVSTSDLGVSEEELLSDEELGQEAEGEDEAIDSLNELAGGEDSPLDKEAEGEDEAIDSLNELVGEGEALAEEGGSVFPDQGDIQATEEDLSTKEGEGVEEQKEGDKGQDFSDVESYGNSTGADLKGFLRYDLFIEGIDSSEIKKQVFLILEDPHFNWSAKEIIQSEKEGKVVIKNLNPVKALCLVSELAFVSVDLSWKQYKALSAPSE